MQRLLSTLAICLSLAAPLSAATVDGLSIHSSTSGTGNATVIFIHGWTCDSSSWTSQVPAFAKKYRVVTVDLPAQVHPIAVRQAHIQQHNIDFVGLYMF